MRYLHGINDAINVMLFDAIKAALLEEAQLKKAINRSKRETNIHHAGGSSEGAGLELEVPDEQKGKSSDTSEGIGLIPGVPDVSKADFFVSEYESWGDSDNDNDDDDQQSDDEQNVSDNPRTSDDEEETQEDEFVHTPENYVPTDDENLKDAKTADEGKGDEEMTDAEKVDVENENVNQEVAGDQVNDDAQATVTAALATQKTEVPLQSSSISSDYVTKFLKFDNIPSADTKIISMMDIKVQHEDPTSPTTTEATISTTSAPDSSTLTAIHQRLSDLENEVKTLRNVDHSSAIPAAIKSEVPTIIKEYLRTNMDDTLHKIQDQGPTADKDEGPPVGPDQRLKRKKTGKDTKPSKMAKSTRTSKGTTKLQPKSTGKFAQAKETVFEAGDTQADPKDWFKKPKRPPTPDPEWNEYKTVDSKPTQKWLSDLAKAKKSSKTFDDLISTPIDFSAFAMNRLQISDLTQDILVGPAYKLLKGTCRSYVELEYNMEECYKALNDQLDWNNPEGDINPFDISKPLPLVQSRNHQIVPVDYFFNNDLAYLQRGSTGRTYTTSLTKSKAAKYDLSKRQTFNGYASNRVSKHDVYSTKRILAVKNVKVNIWYGYGHLEEIEVRKSDQQLYKFMEGDFPRLHLNRHQGHVDSCCSKQTLQPQ
ncbi:hypothetical protein Tco_0828254, partial [Tanacetum coccineum]